MSVFPSGVITAAGLPITVILTVGETEAQLKALLSITLYVPAVLAE
jgi:hypothetical protein